MSLSDRRSVKEPLFYFENPWGPYDTFVTRFIFYRRQAAYQTNRIIRIQSAIYYRNASGDVYPLRIAKYQQLAQLSDLQVTFQRVDIYNKD